MQVPSVRRLAAAATVSTLALTLAACAEEGGSGGGGGGDSVPADATKEDFQAALADMDPVTLVMQSTAPEGAATGRRFEEYAAAVEDWSDGKITFDIAFSNAIAPPDQVDDALADSRIDVGSVVVALEPAKFPVNNLLWDLSFQGSQEPVAGLLQWHGAMNGAALENEEVLQEFEDNDMHVLLPAFQSGSYFWDCAEPASSLDDFQGRTVASQSRIQNAEAEALGMSPSTVPYTEMFESLERGVVDCAASTMTVSSLGGFIPAAPYFSYASDAGISSPGGTIAIGLDRWNELPLAAQQLLHDRVDVILQANYQATWDNVRDALGVVDDEGGAVTQVDADVAAAMQEANDAALDEARGSGAVGDAGALVDSLTEGFDSWGTTVEGLGIDGIDVDYAGFRDWYEAGAPDLTDYFAELAEARSAARPS